MAKQSLFASIYLILSLITFTLYAEENTILTSYPHVVITNGILETSVFLPDPEKGFYRSTRYEWSGMVWQLTYKNHTYFLLGKDKNPLPLKQEHDPFDPNHGASFAHQFETEYPADEKNGKTIMKIGIGNVDIANQSKIVDPGTWKTSHGESWIEFIHELKDENGYGYIYKKRMELVGGKPELIFSNSLTNTGAKPLTTKQYCHNFFTIDDDCIGKNYELELFFKPVFKVLRPDIFKNQTDFNPYAVIQDNKIVIMKDIDVKGGIFAVLGGYDGSLSHNHSIIRNKRTGASVDITGDFPLADLKFWSDISTICPELFVGISLKSGETKEWKRFYRFFIEKK